MRRFPPGAALLAALIVVLPAGHVFAGQGAVRLLYTAPNLKFVEQTSGEVVININDASGSISSVQTAINNARAANPTNIIIIRLTNATYVVSSNESEERAGDERQRGVAQSQCEGDSISLWFGQERSMAAAAGGQWTLLFCESPERPLPGPADHCDGRAIGSRSLHGRRAPAIQPECSRVNGSEAANFRVIRSGSERCGHRWQQRRGKLALYYIEFHESGGADCCMAN